MINMGLIQARRASAHTVPGRAQETSHLHRRRLATSCPPTLGADKGDRKQIVLRSKTDSIYGPYEKKVVFERGNSVIRSCSQGALMQAPDGSWWYTHQLIQNIRAPFQGRPQCLEPVAWIDGWPMIGIDVDGDGIGEPVLHHRKPIEGHPITAPPTRIGKVVPTTVTTGISAFFMACLMTTALSLRPFDQAVLI